MKVKVIDHIANSRNHHPFLVIKKGRLLSEIGAYLFKEVGSFEV